MNETLEKILEHSLQLFIRYGIRSVSMDDIARDLGMSKKTLYQYVSNKAELVKMGMERHLQAELEMVDQLFKTGRNAIDEMIEIGNHVSRQLKLLNTNIIFDLQKYYRESWTLIEQHRTEFIYQTIIKNMEQGINEGLYRSNLKADLIATFYIEKASIFINNDFWHDSKYTPADVYTELLKYHIYGIASEKGMQYLQEKMTNGDTENIE